jgi:chromosome partitioning protein
MKTIAFFNNKGGVGKTSLAYHIAFLFAGKGVKAVAADLDPQANLTTMFLDERRIEDLWPDEPHSKTILGAIQPILDGVGDIGEPHLEMCGDNLGLIVGDLGLSNFEDKLSDAWPRCHDGDAAAFRCTTAFHRIMEQAAEKMGADLVLIDVGPNLGAINRAALIAADHIVVPLAPDLFSLQGLKNLGPTLRRWRKEWADRKPKAPDNVSCPSGTMEPVGYVLLQHAVRLDRPTRAYDRWVKKIPQVYRTSVLDTKSKTSVSPEKDPYLLSMLKHYRSLMPLAMEARKPIFDLLPADGAIGAHMDAVRDCRKDFEQLASRIADKTGLSIP